MLRWLLAIHQVNLNLRSVNANHVQANLTRRCPIQRPDILGVASTYEEFTVKESQVEFPQLSLIENSLSETIPSVDHFTHPLSLKKIHFSTVCAKHWMTPTEGIEKLRFLKRRWASSETFALGEWAERAGNVMSMVWVFNLTAQMKTIRSSAVLHSRFLLHRLLDDFKTNSGASDGNNLSTSHILLISGSNEMKEKKNEEVPRRTAQRK